MVIVAAAAGPEVVPDSAAADGVDESVATDVAGVWFADELQAAANPTASAQTTIAPHLPRRSRAHATGAALACSTRRPRDRCTVTVSRPRQSK
ncbi:hypothetical protein [Rhodococcus koreensis]|uniref:hypothetical protein n=1 Tax=Rhodococcus koreensis TaxID=99653 RepID=UPI0036DC3DA6